MEYLVVCLVALLASGLTLFSGFGLGTLLLPAFAVFFPIEAAVGLTAVVHLLNNLFKLGLVGRYADWSMVLRFGVPGMIAAFGGAWVLQLLGDVAPLAEYQVLGRVARVTVIKLVIGALMIVFAVLEMFPAERGWRIREAYLPLGGVLSGFFGGLSGHQGALRSAFLIRSGLSKEAFIGTNVVIACMVDLARLVVYAGTLRLAELGANAPLLVAATVAAFAGAFAGSRLLAKVTLRQVQVVVAAMLTGVAVALGAGLV